MDEIKKLRRILVIDDSRVVRATLNKHLKGSFELREEADGESAWQTLMLDASLCAVICGRNQSGRNLGPVTACAFRTAV